MSDQEQNVSNHPCPQQRQGTDNQLLGGVLLLWCQNENRMMARTVWSTNSSWSRKYIGWIMIFALQFPVRKQQVVQEVRKHQSVLHSKVQGRSHWKKQLNDAGIYTSYFFASGTEFTVSPFSSSLISTAVILLAFVEDRDYTLGSVVILSDYMCLCLNSHFLRANNTREIDANC